MRIWTQLNRTGAQREHPSDPYPPPAIEPSHCTDASDSQILLPTHNTILLLFAPFSLAILSSASQSVGSQTQVGGRSEAEGSPSRGAPAQTACWLAGSDAAVKFMLIESEAAAASTSFHPFHKAPLSSHIQGSSLSLCVHRG